MENKSKKIHMICNAHIDPIWQWDWPEGVSATLSTFYTAVRLANEFDYIFCHNEVTVYKYIEEYAPELFEKIKELVKAGKWHIMGGWYLQPDCNMPCGESFVRQIREGQRYFKEKFGVCPTTAINLDPFGHSVGLVQIVKKCGQDSYMFMRPFSHEISLPNEQFIWRGLDGSEIKATRICHYGSGLGKSAKTIRDRANEQNVPVGIALWGVGNHGGGPSYKDLTDIKEQLLTDKEIEFIHSTPESFFAEIEP
ncbi:MAG: alpha-mannosidase, partial [Clostridia bacterium]|nr:alpha-mannosidase [Clostridia bacterium]